MTGRDRIDVHENLMLPKRFHERLAEPSGIGCGYPPGGNTQTRWASRWRLRRAFQGVNGRFRPAGAQMITPEARSDEARMALTRTPPREREPFVIENLNSEALA